MQARVSLLTAFALGGSLVLAAGRAGLLPARVVPSTSVQAPLAPTKPCPPPTVKPPAAEQAPSDEAVKLPAPLLRTSVCETPHGTPSLQALTLSPGERPTFAIHCGDRIELVALEDSVDAPPRRVMELTFHPPGPNLVAASAPVATGDINGDGRTDLLVAVRFDDATGAPRGGALYELLSDGHGAYAAPVLLGSQPVAALATGRLLGSDGVDIAVGVLQDPRQGLASELALVRGGAAPVRAAKFKLGVGVRGVAAVDLDLDARGELVIAGSEPSGQVLYLDPQGAERARKDWPLPAATEAFAADLDGDGHDDAVLVGETISVLLSSETPGEPSTLDDSAQLHAVQPVDLNGDGKLDLVGYNAAEVIALVHGDGMSFTRQTLCSLPAGGPTPQTFVVAGLESPSGLVLLEMSTNVDRPSSVELTTFTCEPRGALQWAAKTVVLRDAPLRLHFDLR